MSSRFLSPFLFSLPSCHSGFWCFYPTRNSCVCFTDSLMQAYLQYRRIGHAVRRQLEEEYPGFSRAEKTDELTGGDVTSNNAQRHPPYLQLPGVQLKEIVDDDGTTSSVLLVEWEHDHDPINPRNYSRGARISATLLVTALAFAVGCASSIESGVMPQNAAAFHVSDVVASLATGMYLLGFAAGSMVSGPLSEVVGRNAVYTGSLTLFMIFIMASGLAPNIGAQIVFRFLAGVFGCPPLTCAGGTIADLWNPLEKTLTFPLYAILSFGGPVLGPVIASYMGEGTLSWRWTNWIILIMSGLIFALILLLQPETYGPMLLKWKARHLRNLTGDPRYKSSMDLQKTALLSRISGACIRQFSLTIHEPIILLISLYMTVIYIVLFTFFDGYTYIFSDIHGLSQGLTNIVWVAMYVGIVLAGLFVPLIYRWTKREFKQAALASSSPSSSDTDEPVDPNPNNPHEPQQPQATADEKPHHHHHAPRPENRLWFAMIGSPFIPVSLFWMGWTSYASVSVWSPIVASAVFGFGTITVFISSYMYVIDAYDIYAASALGFMTVSRYCAAGGMTVVGVPFYQNMGVHWTLTILGAISALMVPVPYGFYRWGVKIRGWSRFAV
ncbi:major facilitator superfamily transporter [Aspergillus uvarum CBS 121591]|uniref:Major facilitator superfamily transporter n=1 Tax=Aspergillus uvarum CBS 121591 TaxID=1448315 RepID=A0A319BZJ8_9EURO|nr:major facilitator superfamily transporter [Aspergillus uvarum CBS 121591]PYH79186.1 major facilitator superfamily transporter [Aspergillus uvarum CBS 121591]